MAREQAAQKSAEAETRIAEGAATEQEADEAELIVSNELVAACPMLARVRQHFDEIDPEKLWVVVVLSIADCMKPGAPLASRSIGVSGGEAHRSVVRQILAHEGIDPSRAQRTVSPDGSLDVVAITLLGTTEQE